MIVAIVMITVGILGIWTMGVYNLAYWHGRYNELHKNDEE